MNRAMAALYAHRAKAGQPITYSTGWEGRVTNRSVGDYTLTKKQQSVLDLWDAGKTRKEIAATLGLSVSDSNRVLRRARLLRDSERIRQGMTQRPNVTPPTPSVEPPPPDDAQ